MPERWMQSVKDQVYRQRKKAGLTRLLSEGDSWFGYPIYRNMIDYIDDTEKYAIRRVEQSGDTLQQVLQGREFEPLIDQERPVCILFSAGGNDLINAEWPARLFRPPLDPDNINAAEWQAKVSELAAMYRRVLELIAGRAPLLTHGYDCLVPSDKGVRYDGFNVTGPWFKKAMDTAGITARRDQLRIGKRIVTDFNAALEGVATAINAGQAKRLMVHANLCGTLEESDWANEMHPFSRGFQKVAAKYREALTEVLEEWA